MASRAGGSTVPDKDPYNFRSDGKPGVDGYLGDFRRNPAVFTLYRLDSFPARARKVAEYLLDVDDGAGARECCRFTDDPDDVPAWYGAWNGDEWCEWIMQQVQKIIAEPDIH
ncbi:hypothetical protein [Glycomyces paridis]|uniref:Uncharacterized protein n=1 Tax=Glycomyces paridis TaxID=2126555 RepID=A0A4S8P706_9ACTN|nr:hypothetical protein [Glycomyces paridis]THV23604.1 hypothetical protein E9998_22690 [Glycomyces paridis]